MSGKDPQYELADVHRIAEKGNIDLSRTAQRDAATLGYLDEDIALCIRTLRSQHFVETKSYTETPKSGKRLVKLLDVYNIVYEKDESIIDELYIKLKVTSDKNWLFIESFHQKRH